jgi:spore coat protein U-like protein
MKARRWLLALVVFGATWLMNARPARAQPWFGCTISTTPVSFGTYDVFSSIATASTGTVVYWCGWARSISVYLGKGIAGTNTPARQMASGANRLNYNLYLDAAHTRIWGDPSPNSYSANGVWFSGATLTVYGLIPALQDVATGSYSDSVTATINF